MDNNKDKKELSLEDKIRLIQKEDITGSEKQKKISDLLIDKKIESFEKEAELIQEFKEALKTPKNLLKYYVYAIYIGRK